MLVWLNGKFIERDKAQVAAFDAGLQHGIGLFETLAARNGTPFRAEAHARRLVESARQLLLSESLRVEPLAEAVAVSVQRNGLDQARVRLTVTGGDLNLLTTRGRKPRVDPTILIDVQPPTIYPDAFFDQGVMVTIADGRLNPMSPMAGHKTLDYWPRIHALQHAAAKHGGEALWFTVRNHLAGGSVSNVFLASDGALLTPFARGEAPDDPAGAAVLPGITRGAILELCDDLGLEVRRQTLDINDALSADEIFLTNSSWGVLPVMAVEREQVGDGRVGELTARLRRAWLDLVERETAGAP
jgi:branched-subunit amino acid aminotransferase/4-amino-4-deoxychorismate lyase